MAMIRPESYDDWLNTVGSEDPLYRLFASRTFNLRGGSMTEFMHMTPVERARWLADHPGPFPDVHPSSGELKEFWDNDRVDGSPLPLKERAYEMAKDLGLTRQQREYLIHEIRNALVPVYYRHPTRGVLRILRLADGLEKLETT